MTAPQLGHLWITSLTESMQKGMRQQPSTRPNRHSTTHSRMHMAPGWYTVLVETVAWHAGHTHIIDLCCRGEREIETGKKKHRRISRSDNKLRAKDHVTRERRRHGCWCRRDVCRRLLICRGLLVRRRLLVRLRHDCLLRDAVNIVFHRRGRSRIGHQRLGCVVRSDARHRVESRVFNVSLVQDLRREEKKGRRKEEAKGVNPVREKKKRTEKERCSHLGNHRECSHWTVVDTRLASRAIVHTLLLEPCNTVFHLKERLGAHLDTCFASNTLFSVHNRV